VRFDEVEHRRTGPYERIHERVVHRPERLRPQITERIVDGELGLGGAIMRRDPHHAARNRSGATDSHGLLVNRHRGTACRGGQRGCQRGSTAAEHDDVDFMIPRRHKTLFLLAQGSAQDCR
jgi:hypothetical protein